MASAKEAAIFIEEYGVLLELSGANAFRVRAYTNAVSNVAKQGFKLFHIDGDLDLDVLTTARGSDTVSWWSNDGGLGSQWSQTLVATSFDGASSAAAGDIDGDGKPEIIVAGRQTHNLKIFWNES